MVDLLARAKARKRSAANAEKKAAYHQAVVDLTKTMRAEANAQYGPFNLALPVDCEKLERIFFQKTGIRFYDARDKALQAAGITF